MIAEMPVAAGQGSHHLIDFFAFGLQEIFGPIKDTSIPRIPGEVSNQLAELYLRGMSIRIGRNAFQYWLKENQESFGWEEVMFRLLPSRKKLLTGLKAINSWIKAETGIDLKIIEMDGAWKLQGEPVPSLQPPNIPHLWEFLLGFFQEFTRWAGQGRLYDVNLTEENTGYSVTISKLPID